MRPALWLGWTALLTGILVGLVGLHLDRLPPLSGDDSWIMSASYKLAFSGVFGSDLFTGFFHADQHYFIALPVYQFMQAAVFRLFGAGIIQARSVSLASGIVVLWAVSWLAYRWYGPAVSALATALLLLWPANLLAMGSGLPLVSVSQTGRYDATALALIWLALVLLDRLIRKPSALTALALGICAGLATLTQFFGGFVIPVIAFVCWRTWGAQSATRRVSTWLEGGFLLVVLPYVAYVAHYLGDFRGQSTLKAGRTDFFTLSFYADNLWHEPDRYAHLLHQAVALTRHGTSLGIALSIWLLLLGLPPALAYLASLSRGIQEPGRQIALASLLVFLSGLALLDSTKASLYVLVLWPSLCLSIALAGVRAIRALPQSAGVARRCAGLLLVAVFGLVLANGSRALLAEQAQAARTAPYDLVAARIGAAIGSPGTVIGPERWWWGLRQRRYLALNNLVGQWRHDQAAGDPVDFATLVAAAGGQTIIVDDHVRGDLGRYPAPFTNQFRLFLHNDSRLIATVTDPTYGEIELYQVLEQGGGTDMNGPSKAGVMQSAR